MAVTRRALFPATALAATSIALGASSSAVAHTVTPEEIDWAKVRKVADESFSLYGATAYVQESRDFYAAVKSERGGKWQAAKLAIKAAIKALRKIGKKAWDKTINRLPIPDAAKKYLGYETVMKVLNIAFGFEGTVENMITSALAQIGVPRWVGGIIARTITTLLL